jgi:hypothetical protein
MDADVTAGLIGVGGAILGSVVGALMSGWLTQRQLDKEDLQKDKTAAFSMFQKLSKIYSAEVSLKRHLEEGISMAAQRPNQPRCLSVRPFANDPAPVHFTTEELYRATKIAGEAFMNDFANLDERHNGLLLASAQYRELRIQFFRDMQGSVTPGTDRVISALSEDQKRGMAPRLALLDDLLTQLKEYLDQLLLESRRGFVEFLNAQNRFFKRSTRLTLQQVDGSEVEIGDG